MAAVSDIAAGCLCDEGLVGEGGNNDGGIGSTVPSCRIYSARRP